MKNYIIDGNNLIGKIKVLSKIHQKDKKVSREKLAFMIERYFSQKKFNATLHFDGFESDPIKLSKVKIVYSDNLSADEQIKRQIEQSRNPGELVLITSDHNLWGFGKVCGCSILTSEQFIVSLFAGENKDEEEERIKKLDNTEEFKKLFGVK